MKQSVLLFSLTFVLPSVLFAVDLPTDPEDITCSLCNPMYSAPVSVHETYVLGAPYWDHRVYDAQPTDSSSITLGDCGPEPNPSSSTITVLTEQSDTVVQEVQFSITTTFEAEGWEVVGFWQRTCRKEQTLTLTDGVKPKFDAPSCAKKKFWVEFTMWSEQRVADVSVNRSSECVYITTGLPAGSDSCSNSGQIALGFTHTGADCTPQSEDLDCPDCPIPGC